MERGQQEKEKQTWGTWQELLLVSAVNRHGTRNWDSVAMEVQNRTNSFLTPHNCKERYQELRRRFMEIDDDDEDTKHDESKSKSKTDSKLDDTIPWLDELRKLRVAELKREVQQYDVSIVSLQLKVKRLREERERSSKENENGGEVKPDLDEEIRPEPYSSSAEEEAEATTVEVVVEKPSSGEDENQSFNESNSTDPKSENTRVSGESESKKKHEMAADPVGGGEKPAGEGSSNGSSETIKDSAVSRAFEKSLEAIPKREPGESTELWESVDDSKDSDVQSSASLSSKENLRRKEVSVSSSGEEPETDGISPAIKRISVKSHPLGKFLENIKSHKYGNVFERRLDSQETSKYKSLIRQHMDLETVHERLKEGQYSGCHLKFFRDLLLIINNALVYYPNNSVEFTAGIELRRIVSREMKSRIKKSWQSPESQPQPLLNILPPSLPKAEPEPKSSVPLIVCRKRSSIASKVGKKAVQDNGVVPTLTEEEIVIKKGKRDKPTSHARSNPMPADDSSDKAEKDKKSSVVNTVAKKRSVANFLNRMKKNTSSSSSNGGGTLLESLKVEQKKSSGGGGGGRKEEGTRKRKHSSSPAKRNVGRPPKRNASPPSKRSREMVEVEVMASSKQPPPPRKRSRR